MGTGTKQVWIRGDASSSAANATVPIPLPFIPLPFNFISRKRLLWGPIRVNPDKSGSKKNKKNYQTNPFPAQSV
jgi:hypothetical protein